MDGEMAWRGLLVQSLAGNLCSLSFLLLLPEHWSKCWNWGVQLGMVSPPLSPCALSFSFCLSSSCSMSNDFAPGNASTKPQALHGHRLCLHVSFHVPGALPSIPNPSIGRCLAGREGQGGSRGCAHGAGGDGGFGAEKVSGDA